MVNVSPLWTKTPKQHVKICIIDTGYEKSHPDLPAANVTGWIKNSTCGSNNFTSDWSTDEGGHGTHVSGIISAIMNYRSESCVAKRNSLSSMFHNFHRMLKFKGSLFLLYFRECRLGFLVSYRKSSKK
jgi:subtilisin family serine protease